MGRGYMTYCPVILRHWISDAISGAVVIVSQLVRG